MDSEDNVFHVKIIGFPQSIIKEQISNKTGIYFILIPLRYFRIKILKFFYFHKSLVYYKLPRDDFLLWKKWYHSSVA